MRKTPGAEGGQDDDEEQEDGIGAQEGGVSALELRTGACDSGCLRELGNGFGKAALTVEHSEDYGDDAEDHDNALNEIVDRRCHIAADNDVDACQHGHGDDAPGIVNAGESHGKQA